MDRVVTKKDGCFMDSKAKNRRHLAMIGYIIIRFTPLIIIVLIVILTIKTLTSPIDKMPITSTQVPAHTESALTNAP